MLMANLLVAAIFCLGVSGKIVGFISECLLTPASVHQSGELEDLLEKQSILPPAETPNTVAPKAS